MRFWKTDKCFEFDIFPTYFLDSNIFKNYQLPIFKNKIFNFFPIDFSEMPRSKKFVVNLSELKISAIALKVK